MVCDHLREMDAPVFLLDQARLLETRMRFGSDGIGGDLTVGNARIDLHDVASVYVRPYDWQRLPFIADTPPRSPQRRQAGSLDEQLGLWIETTPAKVVNRPSAMASNNAKPYQCGELGKAGFHIAETLLTNDAAEVLPFVERHGQVIYKSISGIRSIVRRLSRDEVAGLDRLKWCPTQFQQFVPGIDYRVHVVGEDIHATRITAASDDYRYADGSVDLSASRLPSDVEAMCRQAARQLELSVTGLDLRCTPDGEWYAFEANPSPGFSYFERATGQPIARSVAQWLAKPLQPDESASGLPRGSAAL
jgi:glutathione synthase/RimK-type ligase-like ATP-grasp enzyme